MECGGFNLAVCNKQTVSNEKVTRQSMLISSPVSAVLFISTSVKHWEGKKSTNSLTDGLPFQLHVAASISQIVYFFYHQ